MNEGLDIYFIDEVLREVTGHKYEGSDLILTLDCHVSDDVQITVNINLNESQFLIGNEIIFQYLVNNSLVDFSQLLKNRIETIRLEEKISDLERIVNSLSIESANNNAKQNDLDKSLKNLRSDISIKEDLFFNHVPILSKTKQPSPGEKLNDDETSSFLLKEKSPIKITKGKYRFKTGLVTKVTPKQVYVQLNLEPTSPACVVRVNKDSCIIQTPDTKLSCVEQKKRANLWAINELNNKQNTSNC